MALFRQFLSLSIIKWVLLFTGFLTSIVVARYLGPEGKGVIALFTSFATLVSIFGSLGFNASLPYHFQKSEYDPKSLITTTLVSWFLILIVFSGILYWKTELITFYLIGKEQYFPPSWIWLSFITIPGILLTSNLNNLLTIKDSISLLAKMKFIMEFLNIVLLILLIIFLQKGIEGVLISNALVNVVPFFILIYWLKNFNRTNGSLFSVKTFKSLFNVGLQQYVVTIFANIFKRGEILLLVYLTDIQSIGLYSIAIAFYELALDTPRTLVWPIIGKLIKASDQSKVEITLQNIKIQLLMMCLIVFPMIIISNKAVPFLYGYAFKPSVILTNILLMGAFFRIIHLCIYSYFLSIGKPGLATPSMIIVSIVSLGLDFVLVPIYGIKGAAVGTLIAEVVMACVTLLTFKLYTGTNIRHILRYKQSDFKFIRISILSTIKNIRKN